MKVYFCLFVSFLLLFFSFSPVEAQNDTIADEFDAPVILLGEPASGEILLKDQIDKQVYPASITKIMTLLVAMEEIENKEVSMNDEVIVSEKSEGIEGTTLFLEKGHKIELRDLLVGIAVGSANDASVAVAEHISGTVAAFVDSMNKKASEIGLENTSFTNPHGLHDPDHYTTARDIFKMSRALLEHEKVLEWFQIWMDDSFLEGVINDEGVYLSNTNRLIDWYPGCDGLKTGYTEQANHGIAATAKRNDARFVAIVMESEGSEERFDEASELLDYGFSNFEVSKIISQGGLVKNLRVNKGKEPTVSAVAKKELSVVYRRGETPSLQPQVKIDKEFVEAPVKKGEILGKAYVEHEDKKIEVSLVAGEEVAEASYIDLLKRVIKDWVRFGS